MKNILKIALVSLLVTGCNGQRHNGTTHGSHSEQSNQVDIQNLETESVVSFPTVGFKVVYKDTIPYAVQKVFPLFEPQGRNLLYKNWNPTLLKEGINGTVEGQVLYSKYDNLDVMLTVTAFNPEKGHIQYLVVWDDFEIQRIDIYCSKGEAENSTAITWVEHNAGLYEKGIPLVSRFVKEGYLVKAVKRYISNIENKLKDGK